MESLTVEMNILLRKTISYHDYKEDFTTHFSPGFLQVPDMQWNPIKNMERDEVTS